MDDTVARAGDRRRRAGERAQEGAPPVPRRAHRSGTAASDGAAAGSGGLAVCACGTMEGDDVRRAVAVDPDVKERNLVRLRRIEGQVRGLQKMVEEERYCTDVMVQIASVHEALRSVGRALMRNHLKHCATRAIRARGQEAEAMYDELVDLIYKHSR